MMPLWQVKQKFGQAIGEKILSDKKAQEANKPKTDACVYYMEHPEAKGVEEPWTLLKSHLFLCFGRWSSSVARGSPNHSLQVPQFRVDICSVL